MLSPEQAEQIRNQLLEQLSKFPEEQVRQLNEQILNASSEQLEKFISSQSEGNAENDKCIFCEIMEKESKGPRLVEEGEHFVVLAPYASVHPMEFWIIPKHHAQNFLSLTQKETEAFAETLKTTMKGLKDLVNDPPYNYGFHLAVDKESEDYYHWHLEVYPRLAVWAGFEKSTGMYINTVTPETAAAELKKTIQY